MNEVNARRARLGLQLGLVTVFERVYHLGGNVTSAGWQVILCDPIWHVSSRSGEASR